MNQGQLCVANNCRNSRKKDTRFDSFSIPQNGNVGKDLEQDQNVWQTIDRAQLVVPHKTATQITDESQWKTPIPLPSCLDDLSVDTLYGHWIGLLH